MKSLPWFRLYSEIVDDDKLRLLAFEDRWHFIAILSCKAQGVLDRHPETLERRVAVKLGLQLRDAEEVKRRLMEVDLVGEDWQPKNWDKRQFLSDSDPTNAERQKRHREKLKEEKKQTESTANNTVTDSNGVSNARVTPLDTDTDTDTDTEGGGGFITNSRERAREAPQVKTPPAPAKNNFSVDDVAELYRSINPEDQKFEIGLALDTRANIEFLLNAEKPGRDPDKWRRYFEYVRKSQFINGQRPGTRGREPFKRGIWWAVRPENFAKVLTGFYHDDDARCGHG